MIGQKFGRRTVEMIGQKFGRWTVLEEIGRDKHSNKTYKCLCSCGNEFNVMGTTLRTGKSTKCVNCNEKEKVVCRRIHGKSSTKTYFVWAKMKARCLNSNNKDYKYYGGRGITFDKAWMDFQNFIDDMGEQPTGLQIDRIDNDKGYSKDNCQWVTPKQNSSNRRSKGSCKV